MKCLIWKTGKNKLLEIFFFTSIFISLVVIIVFLVWLYVEENSHYEHPKTSKSMSQILNEMDQKNRNDHSDEMDQLRKRLRGE